MYWKNPEGFKLVKDVERSTWWKAIYHFTLDTKNPLTFVDDDGKEYQPNRSYYTDMGSIPRFPPFLQFFVPKDRFLAFYPHDSSYQDGGLFVNGVFKLMTREECDEILKKGMECDPVPAWKVTIYLVWKHVRMYGSRKCDEKEPPKGLNLNGPLPVVKQA